MKNYHLASRSPIRSKIALSFVVASCLLVSACGQKGPLYKPTEEDKTTKQQSSVVSIASYDVAFTLFENRGRY